MPLLLLGLVELALRLMGFGHSTTFFKPATINGETCLVENDKFGLSFFPPELARSPAPVVMKARKPPNAYRIFLFGESAALGDPAPAFGLGRYLQALLRERFPDTRFEVVCVAMTAINSHAILPIARECANYDGDLWIIYMGNNEMVGPYGAATVFGTQAPSGQLVRTRLAVGRLRVVQAMESLGRSLGGQTRDRTWEGMKLFLENKLPPDDPKREVVYRNFRENLDALLRTGERAKVPVILSTVAVNLRDFAPLAASAVLAAGSHHDFTNLVATGVASQRARNWSGAIQAYDRAAKLAPGHADILFRLGQCHLALSNRGSAQAYFQLACNNDALPFRADAQVNEIIAAAASQSLSDRNSVVLFDAPGVMARRSSDGIPGDESFYEHVHLNFDGNFHLAKAFAEMVFKQLPASLVSQAASDWATQEQCERSLGLTDWNRRKVLEEVERRLQQPPFAEQPDNARRLRHWRAQLEEVQGRLTPVSGGAARALYLEALQSQPEDFRLHWNFAEFLEAIRDLTRAVEEWRKVQSLVPQHHIGYYQVGRLLVELDQRGEARRWLEQAVALRPDLGRGWLELGQLSAAENRHEDALRHLTRARKLLPGNPRIPFLMAESLSQLKRTNEAIEEARYSLQADPNYLEARVFLGEQLSLVGRFAAAQAELEEALKLNPDHPQARLQLGVALLKQGRAEEAIRHLEEALRLDPDSQAARQYLKQLTPP